MAVIVCRDYLSPLRPSPISSQAYSPETLSQTYGVHFRGTLTFRIHRGAICVFKRKLSISSEKSINRTVETLWISKMPGAKCGISAEMIDIRDLSILDSFQENLLAHSREIAQ
jgi:hypothetical protein